MLQTPICALALLLAAPGGDDALAARLRALSAVGSAEVPRPSRDGARLAFVTTLFGSRQVAVMPIDGGYPIQLTNEPGGALSVRYSPADPHQLAAVVLRDGRRRVVLLDDQGGPAEEIDRSPGDQLLGGFTRDGKRLFFVNVNEGKARLFQLQIEEKKAKEVLPAAGVSAGTGRSLAPYPGAMPVLRDAGSTDAGAAATGHVPAPYPGAPIASRDAGFPDAGTGGSPDAGTTSAAGARQSAVAMSDVLPGIVKLGPPSPDGRYLVLVTAKGGGEDLYSLELSSTRATLLVPHEGKATFTDPRWSPDARTVYVLDDAGRDHDGVDAVNVVTRERKTIYAPSRRVEAFALTEDGHRLAVAEDASGETVFGLLELPGLRVQPLPQPPSGALAPAPDGEGAMSWSAGGDRLFFSWAQADDTTDVLAFRVGFGLMVRLTRSPRPGLGAGALLRPSRITLTGADGKEMGAWLWRPADSSRPRLALLVTGEEIRPVLDPRIDALVSAGIAVLGVNPRDLRGRLETAEEASPDLIAALQSAQQSQGDLDSRRPLLVAIGKGAVQAERLVRTQPDSFSGTVAVEPSARVQGAASAPTLQDLVRVAREKLR